MGFNGEILVGRGKSFISALTRFWNWDEEVRETRPMREDWLAIYVRSPAEPGELVELAEAADGPVLACLVFEGTTGHVRGIGTTGSWEAWLNPDDAARLKAWDTVDKQIGGGLYPDGTEQDHAKVQQLKARFGAALDAERPAAIHAATVWALEAELPADAERVEEVLATPWGSSAEHGFLALLSALGISST
jgi:hypothetical protein